MTEERSDSKLVKRAEALLAGAELREPDFEIMARRIDGALATAGRSDDSLLLPPLPESVEDGSMPVETAPETPREPAGRAVAAAPAPREEGGLAELARAALARREAKDAVSIAKESLAIASQQRPPAPPTIEIAPEPPPPERKVRTIPPTRRSRPALDTRGPWIGVAVAAVGLAAGFGLYLSGKTRTEIIQVPVAETAAPAATAPGAMAKTPDRAPTAPEVTPDMLPKERRAPGADEAPVLTPEALAREPSKGKPAASVAEARPAAGATTAAAPTVGTSTAVVAAGAAKAEKIVLEEDHTTSGGAPKPGATPGLKPAELNAHDGMADRPSTGAAQAAVGAVLGAARSCIAGQPQGSSATLVFGSSGEVTSVSVSGPAQGTPAAACIQSALKKARVQPFAAASFSLGVTVRPP